MTKEFEIRIVGRKDLTEAECKAVVSLCNRAFGGDYEPALDVFTDAIHLLGSLDGDLVSHALWYTRWLQIGNGPLLRTAYVEEVVTEESFRRRGYASQIMRLLVAQIDAYELAALSPARAEFYEHLGWEIWTGPLFIRTDHGLLPSSSDEEVMIYRLPLTPQLNTGNALSAEWRKGELW